MLFAWILWVYICARGARAVLINLLVSQHEQGLWPQTVLSLHSTWCRVNTNNQFTNHMKKSVSLKNVLYGSSTSYRFD